MTASTTTAVEFDVDRICRRALQLAGLLDATQGSASANWTATSAMARDFLEADIEQLQTLGVMQRTKDFYEVTLVASTASYSLPSSTLDVFGSAMLQLTGEDTETAVSPMDQDTYHRIVDKTIAGRPTRYFAQRGATFVLYLWPVPDSANVGTLTLQRHKVIPTATDGAATLAFERHWTEYFCWSLAHKLVVHAGQSVERCLYFRTLAEKAEMRAKSASVGDYADTYIHNAHMTGWR